MRKSANRGKAFVWGLFHRPYIPPVLLKSKGPRILHISDTPTQIYPFIYKIIERLNPAVIIHTGDLADNYKIQYCKQHIREYKESAVSFLNTIKRLAPAAHLVVVAGNHDQSEVIRQVCTVTNEGDIPLNLYGRDFYFSHSLEESPKKRGYYCFGHEYEPSHEEDEHVVMLNGILNINVIDVDTWRIFHLEYPYGTNEYRKMSHSKTGL